MANTAGKIVEDRILDLSRVDAQSALLFLMDRGADVAAVLDHVAELTGGQDVAPSPLTDNIGDTRWEDPRDSTGGRV